MREETKYYGKMMKKYHRKDAIEWTIGVGLCILAIPLISVGLFLPIATGIGGISILAYCAGKDAVTLRMLDEELTEDDKKMIMRKQHNVW